jgi:hypothetical protein
LGPSFRVGSAPCPALHAVGRFQSQPPSLDQIATLVASQPASAAAALQTQGGGIGLRVDEQNVCGVWCGWVSVGG